MNAPESSLNPQIDLPENSSQSLESSSLSTESIVAPAPLGNAELRVKLIVTGALFPAFCFAASGMEWNIASDRWQSGRIDMYCSLMLERNPILIMLPMFLYSMLSLSVCCIWPQQLNRTWAHVGVYGGAVLSGLYLLLVVMSTAVATFIFAAFVAPILYIIVFLIAKLSPRARQITIWQIMVLTSLVAVIVAVSIRFGSRFIVSGSIMSVWIAVLAATPTLNFVTYVRATAGGLSLPLNGNQRRHLILGMFTWVAALITSLKFAIEAMFDTYSTLPKNPPNCFVSSAAACGHQRFVGVEQFTKAAKDFSGDKSSSWDRLRFPVNMQMCRLKFLEVCLHAAMPNSHRLVRVIYNRLGPKAADLCRCSKWTADASYLCLKPLELIASCLQLLLRFSDDKLRLLYRQK